MDTSSQESNYSKEVLEIHSEFHRASDLLILQANERLQNKNMQDFEIAKAKRLHSIGATQAKGANLISRKEISEDGQLLYELAELIKHYQFRYPNYKFITEEQVKAICHKYNLVCGRIDRYKGFIPDKNLQEAELFKTTIREEDMGEDIWSVGVGLVSFLESYSDNSWEEYDDGGNLAKINQRQYKYNYRKAKMKICAPIADMDMTDIELEDGYKMKDVKPIVIPDPIILQSVNGGYLIVTKWGDEASDDIVVNHKDN
jgi:hypothetical protein